MSHFWLYANRSTKNCTVNGFLRARENAPFDAIVLGQWQRLGPRFTSLKTDSFSSPMDGHEIGLALNKKILSTLKTLTRLIGPEASINNLLASAIAQQAGKREDGIYAVYEGIVQG